jgi:hypothetical protein
MKTITNLLLALLLCSTAYAQTNVSGGIFSNTTWTKANSPYIVTDTIVVFPGVTLTIDPGVIVKFNSGLGLELRGKLIAIGNANDTITFTSSLASPVPSSWRGINVVGTTNPLGLGDQVTMEYCKAEYAHYFVNLDIAYHGPYIFRHCYFANNYQVNYDGGMPSTIFENCKFELNHTGLGGCQFDSRVSNSVFINNVNGLEGIANVDTCLFSGNTGIALSPYGSTIGCTIQNNNIGVSCYFNSANNTFVNNNVSDNVIGVEMLSYFNEIAFTGNTICHNSTYNIKLLHNNNADLSFNCWCSSESTYIRSTIYDGYVNLAYGLVNFMPVMLSCPQIKFGIKEPQQNVLTIFPKLFPNPFSNQLTISLADNEQSIISLYNFRKQQILKQSFTNTTTINTEQLAEGIYFYELRNDKGIIKKGKVVKQ